METGSSKRILKFLKLFKRGTMRLRLSLLNKILSGNPIRTGVGHVNDLIIFLLKKLKIYRLYKKEGFVF